MCILLLFFLLMRLAVPKLLSLLLQLEELLVLPVMIFDIPRF